MGLLSSRARRGLALALFAALFADLPVRADILYVQNSGTTRTIEKFTSGGVGSLFVNTAPDHPQSIAFDHAGNLYAGFNSGTRIDRFSPTGVRSLFTGGGNVQIPVDALAFDSAGNLFASTGHTILKFTPGGVSSVFASGIASDTLGLAFDRAGTLFASSGTKILQFTPDGVGSVFASTGLVGPWGLAFDGAGNLYAANDGNNTIEKFTPGGDGSLFASTGLSAPTGLAFDSTGNLYAANAGGSTIEKFTPDGTPSLFASTGLDAPYFLAFTNDAGVPLAVPIPEPSTWAILCLGLAALLGRAANERGRRWLNINCIFREYS